MVENVSAKDTRKSNEKIEESFVDVERSLVLLECILTQVENGDIPINEAKQTESPPRSIANLIKETPIILAEIAKEIRSKTDRLRNLVL